MCLCARSSSCLLEEATGWCRWPCTGVIFMDRAAPNAVWLETRTVPGTAPSAPDTFQPPKGNAHRPIKPLSQRVDVKPWHSKSQHFCLAVVFFRTQIRIDTKTHTCPALSLRCAQHAVWCSKVFGERGKLRERELCDALFLTYFCRVSRFLEFSTQKKMINIWFSCATGRSGNGPDRQID